jgi:hypothetical protein
VCVDVALHVVEQVEAAPAHRTRVRLHASVVHLSTPSYKNIK